jgi:hypothetical protein
MHLSGNNALFEVWLLLAACQPIGGAATAKESLKHCHGPFLWAPQGLVAAGMRHFRDHKVHYTAGQQRVANLRLPSKCGASNLSSLLSSAYKGFVSNKPAV